jgi:membrane-bound lytic murein transglycosylase MltF
VLQWQTQRDSALLSQNDAAVISIGDAVQDQSIDFVARGGRLTASDFQQYRPVSQRHSISMRLVARLSPKRGTCRRPYRSVP